MALRFNARTFLVACLIDINRNPNTRSPILDDLTDWPALQLRNHCASHQKVGCPWCRSCSPATDHRLVGSNLLCQPCQCLAVAGHLLSCPFSEVHHSHRGNRMGHNHSNNIHCFACSFAFIFRFHLFWAKSISGTCINASKTIC